MRDKSTHVVMSYRINRPKISLAEAKLISQMSGNGLFSRLKESVKKYGSEALKTIQKYVKPGGLKAYQLLANSLRTKGRKLELGELHPGDYNYMGPGTNIEKYSYIRPINSLDALAREHDLVYQSAKSLQARERALAVQSADEKMLDGIRRLRASGELQRLPFGDIAEQVIFGKNTIEKLLSILRRKPVNIYS